VSFAENCLCFYESLFSHISQLHGSYKYSAKLVTNVVHKLQSKLPKWAEEHFKKDYKVLCWDLLFNKSAVCVAHLIQT
jgi:hypothetical protein